MNNIAATCAAYNIPTIWHPLIRGGRGVVRTSDKLLHIWVCGGVWGRGVPIPNILLMPIPIYSKIQIPIPPYLSFY